MITPIAGQSTPLKPGSAMRPFFGVSLSLLDGVSGAELPMKNSSGVLAIKMSTPGMARTILGDHDRYIDTYFKQYPGYYLTGDGARADEDGHIWITGRIDDVVNVSGHRIGTAEVDEEKS